MTNPKKRISRAFKNKREKKKKIESEWKNANFDSCFRMFMQRFRKNHRNVSCSVNAWMWARVRWKEIGKENGKGSFFTSAFSYVNSFKDYVEIAHTIFFLSHFCSVHTLLSIAIAAIWCRYRSCFPHHSLSCSLGLLFALSFLVVFSSPVCLFFIVAGS